MFSHALIPLDGSPLAERALEPAQNIVRPQGKITLMTAITTSTPIFKSPMSDAGEESSANSTGDVVAQARLYLDHIATRLRLNGFEVQVEVRSGEPAEVISELALILAVDVIAICTHGRSGLGRLIFGSVTTNLLNTAPCPVLVIPSRVRQRVKEETPAKNDMLKPGLAH